MTLSAVVNLTVMGATNELVQVSMVYLPSSMASRLKFKIILIPNDLATSGLIFCNLILCK